jgi:hypothetical protein
MDGAVECAVIGATDCSRAYRLLWPGSSSATGLGLYPKHDLKNSLGLADRDPASDRELVLAFRRS